MTDRELCTQLVTELVTVLGALAGGSATHETGTAPAGDQWVVSVTAGGSVRAAITLSIDVPGATSFARAILGEEAPADQAVEDTVREAVNQAIGSVLTAEGPKGLTLALTGVTRVPSSPAETRAISGHVAVEGLSTPLEVAVYLGTVPAPAAAPAKAAQVLAGIDDPSRLDVILDIDLPVIVRFGHTEMPIRALTRIGPGSVIDLGRSPDDPVELLVSNRVVARGEVVVVGGNYGIRIVDIVSTTERMRSMEA